MTNPTKLLYRRHDRDDGQRCPYSWQIIPADLASLAGETVWLPCPDNCAASGPVWQVTPPVTDAEAAFTALTDQERFTLLRNVFEILEYDINGDPGVEWDSDTTQALGEVWPSAFTSPDDPHCDGCGRWVTPQHGVWVTIDGQPRCPYSWHGHYPEDGERAS